MGILGRVVVTVLPIMPKFIVGWVSRRYHAGIDLESALETMNRLSKEGACFTVDVLGEEITTMEEAQFFIDEYNRVLDSIVAQKIDANLSIKPTAFGLLIDPNAAEKSMEEILRKAASHDIFVRLDMEDHRVTQRTIDLVLTLHQMGLKNVGTVLQGRLFRTLEDIQHLTEELGEYADHRICKGIYLESANIAHTEKRSITKATNEAIDTMLESGAYTAIASHDTAVIEHSLSSLKRMGMGPNISDPRSNAGSSRIGKGPGYEFQMLLGVRGDIRRKLAKEGHMTRIYLPYGSKWYEYGIRRLRENPDVAWHITKAILMPWSNRR
ncbi:MAG: hypothetical protein CMB17_06345 [Euryarchaeota archaeon]|nr:hypothetical protein [Euryarchaeota archaeon]|tara:strand:+ start:1940 stop:2914 length:975 start_codon:yes stop_codon:yes gene_type:complete